MTDQDPSPSDNPYRDGNETSACQDNELARSIPGLHWLLHQVGIENLESQALLQLHTIRRFDQELLPRLNPRPEDVAHAWVERTTERREPDLPELLLFDYWISKNPLRISRALPSRYRLDKTINTVHEFLGTTLYRQAQKLGWTRPYILCRTMQLAKIYLKQAIAARELVSDSARYQLLGKYAVASAFRSQYIPVSLMELYEAEDYLLESIEAGNRDPEAYAYLAELRLRRYDLTKDVEILKFAIRDLEHHSPRTATLSLHGAEMWMKLSAAASEVAQAKFLARAAERCNEAQPDWKATDQRVRKLIIENIISYLHQKYDRDVGSALSGIRFPFGLPEALTATCSSLDTPLAACILEVLRRIEASPLFLGGEPLCRRIVADAYTALANLGPATAHRNLCLTHAVAARNGDGTTGLPLADDPSILLQASDLLELYPSQTNVRRKAIQLLLRIATDNHNLATPLVLIGRDLEANGALPMSAPSGVTPEDGWMDAVRNGDSSKFYELAALSALSSQDLRRSNIGDRGAVMTVGDYHGLLVDTFVFKGTTKVNYERERDRLTSLQLRLRASNGFGVAEIIKVVDRPLLDPTFSGVVEVVSLQRYQRGTPASQLDIGTETDKILLKCAQFLAVIHSDPAFRVSPPNGVRKQIKEHDLGLWLKNIVGKSEYLPLFDEWWTLGETLPVVPKRDAHLGNWLVSSDGKIIAIDFESSGWRPVGYELAQLTDDVRVITLDRDGWATRMRIVDAYINDLTEVTDKRIVRRGYCLGLVARAIRLLATETDGSSRSRGIELLLSISDHSDVDIARYCQKLYRMFNGIEGSNKSHLSKGKRIAISKTLSFILRHDADNRGDDHGWRSIPSVIARAQEVGRRITREELLSVASAPAEQRFEIHGDSIRARYGHSIEVQENYPTPATIPSLYHSTAIAAMNRIFTDTRGLLPMERQWVHFSDDPKVALMVGARKISPLLLRVPHGVNVVGFKQASPKTWVANSVNPADLEIVTAMEQLWLGLLELDS